MSHHDETVDVESARDWPEARRRAQEQSEALRADRHEAQGADQDWLTAELDHCRLALRDRETDIERLTQDLARAEPSVDREPDPSPLVEMANALAISRAYQEYATRELQRAVAALRRIVHQEEP